ncbi:MAG: threonine/serine dehydratase [Actinomycetota bacterium]|nr:threonine/serine dehydratase [Actinomycetota bacterium]
MEPPTIVDVLQARRRIAPYLHRTPLFNYPALDELVGTEVWVKHENHQPVGAFKVRGGVNLVLQLTEDERRRGLIAASTGNHGQSLAYAGHLFGVRVLICVPENANPVKVESMQALGAEIVFHGRDYDEAREHAEALAAAQHRYVHSGDEPPLLAGVGTLTLEILEDQPDVEAIIVPIGGGSAAAGACVVVKGMGHPARAVGVQSEAAPAAFRSWQARKLVEDRMETFAEGLATRTAFDLPQRILWDHLDDFVLVSDDEIRSATRHMIEKTRNLVEPAGAAPLAAALKLGLAGKKVALMCSGGNISPSQLRDLLS